MSSQLTQLDSGIRVTTEALDNVRSVALGFWVRTGSRDETPAQAGVSHFLEHLLFKGTKDHSSADLAEIFDGLGASTNAATSKETTHLYARFLDTHTDRVFELLSQMLLAPTFPEVDSERQVVIEEIAMYEDEPSDRVHDVLDATMFGDHPLGRRVLGTAEVIGSIPVPDIGAYHGARYAGDNIVVAAAGNVDHDQIVELARRNLEPAAHAAGGPELSAPQWNGARYGFYEKETEQYHICFGGRGVDRGDERRYALGILDSVFGGSMSSRLFQEVREKRGLAYSVASYSQQYADSGTVAVYVGTRPDNVAEACEIIGRELGKLYADGISADELARGKEHVKGRLVLSSESSTARMSRLARSALFDLPLLDLDEMIARVDAVTLDEVALLASEFYDPTSLSAVAVGGDEDCFRSALSCVNEELAAA